MSVFAGWVTKHTAKSSALVTVLKEDLTNQKSAIDAVCAAMSNNLLDEALQQLDKKKRFNLLIQFLSRTSRARAADLGEVFTTEHIAEQGDYPILIRRLRFKDVVDQAMRGDDVLAFRKNKRGLTEILKAESKARRNLTKTVLAEAHAGLAKFGGRPNPHSVAFVIARLRGSGRDQHAEIVEAVLRRTPPQSAISHLVFTTSGNDSERVLCRAAKNGLKRIPCSYVGLVLHDYSNFIELVFKKLNGTH